MIKILLLIALCGCAISAQTNSDLQKMVETENAFARAAEAKGTKAAFLEFLSDEAIVFRPTEVNGKLFWKNAKPSPAVLAWKPAWADISSTGELGYTTGGWELRPKGKTGKATAFGQYVTLWQKLPEGNFKVVLDTGVSFERSEMKNSRWNSPPDAAKGERAPKNTINLGTLTDIYSKKSLSTGYFNHFADDVLVLREGVQPVRGKRQAFLKLENLDSEFPDDGFLTFDAKMSKNYGNMMYSWGVYNLKMKDDSVRKWNFMQIWKYRGDRWQIVLDVFAPLKEEKK